jgi:Predicted membrane protein
MLNPFDLKTALSARHAQHVVLIHFPIALFISAVVFDLVAHWTKRSALADTTYYNLAAASLSIFPVLATGIFAWQFQLEGQKLKGILLLHLMLAGLSSVLIWLAWWTHFHSRRRAEPLPRYRLAIEFVGVALVALTGHLGGFLSGVNGIG